MTFANADVLAFYKELPFNYGDKVEDHARRIESTDLAAAYPVLPPLLERRPRVLEIGCGVGWLACGIASRWACPVTAIDFNPVVIARAGEIADYMGLAVDFRVADLFVFEPEAAADLVISLGVLHHTDNCAEAIRRCLTHFTAPGGHFFVGLYHTYGRRPFLRHFEDMKGTGASETDMLREYGRLHHWLGDETQLTSWFRDQVLHPHETQHSLAEIAGIAERCGAELVATSINRFGPVDDLDSVIAQEPEYEKLAAARLDAGQYFPGFFVSLFRRSE